MKSRAEIKRQALANFKANYWPMVGVAVLISFIIGILSSTGFGWIVAPSFVVGISFFYIANYFGDKENGKLENVFNIGFANFGRNLGSILLEGLLVFAWSLLFFIPGIIKAYSYSMTQYILADCPDVSAVDAITISKRMMKGHKWEYFVFQLSFFGWGLLSILTLGLLSIFFLDPYIGTATAGYYAEVKKAAIESGAVTAEQFSGAPLDGSAEAAPAEVVDSEEV